MQKECFVCESNTGPSDLQSDALPTELTKQLDGVVHTCLHNVKHAKPTQNSKLQTPTQ